MKASLNTTRIAVYLPDDLKTRLDVFKASQGIQSDSGAIAHILKERLLGSENPPTGFVSIDEARAQVNEVFDNLARN